MTLWKAEYVRWRDLPTMSSCWVSDNVVAKTFAQAMKKAERQMRTYGVALKLRSIVPIAPIDA